MQTVVVVNSAASESDVRNILGPRPMTGALLGLDADFATYNAYNVKPGGSAPVQCLQDLLEDGGCRTEPFAEVDVRDRFGTASLTDILPDQLLQPVGRINHDGLESVGTDISGLLVGSVTDARHRDGSLESTTNTSINTLGLAPGRVSDANELVRLVASELL